SHKLSVSTWWPDLASGIPFRRQSAGPKHLVAHATGQFTSRLLPYLESTSSLHLSDSEFDRSVDLQQLRPAALYGRHHGYLLCGRPYRRLLPRAPDPLIIFSMLRLSKRLFSLALLAAGLQPSFAFVLLGPCNEAYQVPTIGYNLPTDIGAPKNLGEEYR